MKLKNALKLMSKYGEVRDEAIYGSRRLSVLVNHLEVFCFVSGDKVDGFAIRRPNSLGMYIPRDSLTAALRAALFACLNIQNHSSSILVRVVYLGPALTPTLEVYPDSNSYTTTDPLAVALALDFIKTAEHGPLFDWLEENGPPNLICRSEPCPASTEGD